MLKPNLPPPKEPFVLFDEPAPSQGDIRFPLLGIPVRIHPMFWLSAVMLGYKSPTAADLLAWVAAMLVGILFHELGHALVMRPSASLRRLRCT